MAEPRKYSPMLSPSTTVNIRVATNADAAAWDGYLKRAVTGGTNSADQLAPGRNLPAAARYHPAAARHHSEAFAWSQIIQDSFHHQPYYLIAETAEGAAVATTVGVLPLVLVKSMLFGRALISVPYLNGCGIVADSTSVRDVLADHAIGLSQELGVRYLELRHREAVADFQARVSQNESPALAERSHKVAMKLALHSDTNALFQSFPAKLRSQVRRPAKSGLTAQVCTGTEAVSEADGLNQLRAYYRVFAENMRDLGTPVYPLRFFRDALRSFGSRARLIVVWDGQIPAAGGITIGAGSSCEIPFASSLRAYNSVSANMLLYWTAIEDAATRGFHDFDFGRSSLDSGTMRFKQQWGSVSIPLHWYYHVNVGAVPDVNPKSAKFEMVVRAWQQLPICVANTLGPWLTRSLP